MSVSLRIMLIVVSVVSVVYAMRKIRKAQLNIDDSIYWIAVSVVLLALSIFPQIATVAAKILGFEAPSNFVLVFMIFVVLAKLFQVAVDLSVTKHRLNLLIQKMALSNKQSEDKDDKKDKIIDD